MTRYLTATAVASMLGSIAFVIAAIVPTIVLADEADKPLRALLVCGGCCHDYAKQKDIITKGVSARANVEWTISYDPTPNPKTATSDLNPIYQKEDWSKGYDVVVHDECSADVKDLKIIDRILKPHREGLPGVVLHCGMHCYRSEGWPNKVTPWFEFTGLETTGHDAQEPISISFVDRSSPILKGAGDWTTIKEELYNNITGHALGTAKVLARGTQTVKKGNKQVTSDNVLVWTNQYNGKTRVFATTLGHNNETVADPRYLDLITRGLLWSVDKLDDAHLKPAKRVLIE